MHQQRPLALQLQTGFEIGGDAAGKLLEGGSVEVVRGEYRPLLGQRDQRLEEECVRLGRVQFKHGRELRGCLGAALQDLDACRHLGASLGPGLQRAAGTFVGTSAATP